MKRRGKQGRVGRGLSPDTCWVGSQIYSYCMGCVGLGNVWSNARTVTDASSQHSSSKVEYVELLNAALTQDSCDLLVTVKCDMVNDSYFTFTCLANTNLWL